MTDADPDIAALKHQQLDQERAEREGLAEAVTPADADRHRRRAEKARYLARSSSSASRLIARRRVTRTAEIRP